MRERGAAGLLPVLAGGQCGTCLTDRDDDSWGRFQPRSLCISQVSMDEIWEVFGGGDGGVGWGGNVRAREDTVVWEMETTLTEK